MSPRKERKGVKGWQVEAGKAGRHNSGRRRGMQVGGNMQLQQQQQRKRPCVFFRGHALQEVENLPTHLIRKNCPQLIQAPKGRQTPRGTRQC